MSKEEKQGIKLKASKSALALRQNESITGISKEIIKQSSNILIHMIDAGKVNLMQGYASSMWVNHLLFAAGLIDTTTRDNVALLSGFFSAAAIGESLWDTLFGKGTPMGTGLTTLVDQSVKDDDEDDRGKRDAQVDLGAISTELAKEALGEAALAALAV